MTERMLSGYAWLTGVATPLGRMLVSLRRHNGKEHPLRFRERFGLSSGKCPDGPVIWVHAASVGETIAILPLVERMAAAGLFVVFTTVTVTSSEILESRLPERVIHQFVPLDMLPYVRRFLERWKPQLAIFVESEIWPVAIRELARRKIPLVVSNARMSDRSARRWTKAGGIARAIFGKIDLCLAQSAADAERFRSVGTAHVIAAGNIKFDAEVPEAPKSLANALTQAIGERPVLLAASTHPGEEELVLDAYEKLILSIPNLLLILAPRHPARGVDVMSLAVHRQFDVCQRSAGALPSRATSVYVADTVGELGTFFRLADVAFVGGSLVARGGHNPIEPARLGAAVVTGPHVRNFSDIYAALFAEDAAGLVSDADELASLVERLFTHRLAREKQVESAAGVVARFTGALEETWNLLQPLLKPMIVSARLEARP